MEIGIVAPATRVDAALTERVTALAQARFPDLRVRVHPHCFLSCGHFAGPDAARLEALVEYANDPTLDAVWFARGGYGSNRIAEDAIARFADVARRKIYLGYSDMGFLLAGLARHGYAAVHGPMPADILRPGGEAAVERALRYLTRRDPATLEPAVAAGEPALAFNMTILSAVLGTRLEPDFRGRTVMLEDVSEYLYRIDRTLFHLTAAPALRQATGLRLGRVSDIPENDPPFGEDAETIVRRWCARSGIAYLGRADIGHDADNKIVPFPRP